MNRSKKKGRPVPLVGITGGIGSGKSFLSDMFKQLGAFVVDADKIGKEVLEQDENVLKNVVKQFGNSIINGNNKIDRKMLAKMVFGDTKELEKLNAIIHPPMIRNIEGKIKDELKTKRSPMIVVDAALIFEAKVENKFDFIVNVHSNIENQIKRLSRRNKMSKKEVLKRMESQISPETKKNKSDYNIENNGTEKELKIKAGILYKEILTDFAK